MNNKITIHGEIGGWDWDASSLKRELSRCEGNIIVDIFSYGGDVFEGIAMYNMLRDYSDTKGKVTTVNSSVCASIASLLFLAGDKRMAHENATIMIHKAWMLTAGNNEELVNSAKMLDAIDNLLANTYAKTMDMSKDEIKKLMENDTWYIGLDAMRETGFVDEFIKDDNTRVDAAAMKSTFNKEMGKIAAKVREFDVSHDFKNVMESIKKCNGGECQLDNTLGLTAPTASLSDKSVTKKTGVNMTFDRENLDETEQAFNVLLANKETITNRNESLKVQMQTLKASLETKEHELSEALREKVNAKDKLESVVAEIKTRLMEAKTTGVSIDAAIKMVEAETSDEASKIAIEAKESVGGTPQFDNVENKESALLIYANKNKGIIK